MGTARGAHRIHRVRPRHAPRKSEPGTRRRIDLQEGNPPPAWERIDAMSSNPDETPKAAAPTPAAGFAAADDAGTDARMSEAQAAELRQLAEEKGEAFDGNLTRQQAADRIEALKSM